MSIFVTMDNEYTYDYLIVGAGLSGATFAHQATLRGKRCLVIDSRLHTGGNIYCEDIEGINVHRYGAHIFHTSDSRVWDYVNSIVPFNRYTNAPVAIAPDGKLYNLPFNMNTFNRMWGCVTPHDALAILDTQRAQVRQQLALNPGGQPHNLEEQALLLVGPDIYNTLIKGYTEKQWGRDCRDLPASIIRRLPVRLTYDNNYFNDSFQGIPMGGYNRLIDGMLKGVDVRLGCDWFDHRDELENLARSIVYTGPIDRFFNYCHGTLQYRTVTFETELLDCPNYQGNAVVNYTARDIPYTRIIEHKHFEALTMDQVYANPRTVISREYSTEWHPGMEPFYPVNDSTNESRYNLYRDMTDTLPRHDDGTPRYIFAGRLARYRYYDMAPVIREILDLFNN